ncbi:putative fungal-specific transcription factor [Amylocarpus encephaloides]|uniref:Fungal-specific transcription factor n=1 Tax=Amylocarpus encephaloides TaxID=45428 RepID=A0A9P7YSE9_9HELO|nr:putative fungal-specific transcription factor [Amylocarpus encephaloides]
MVRATIACAWCRRSKIRCVHEGVSPCRNCLKAGRSEDGDCVLSPPRVSPRRTPKADHVSTPAVQSLTHQGGDLMDRTPHAVINYAVGNFRRLFPELGFLHTATFEASSQGDKSGRVLRAAIISLAFTSKPSGDHRVDIPEYATYVRGGLSSVLFDPPRLETVQALLIFSMFEWSKGCASNAWMMTGTAIRMMQSLEALRDSKFTDERQQEVHNRTFWGCFVMDRLILCGKYQSFALPVDQMPTPLPIGEEDFAFGQSTGPKIMARELNTSSSGHSDIDHHYSIMVRGFDIWSRILKWVINGGRRQPGMTSLTNCPWSQGSSWGDFHGEIQAWRQGQNKRVQYPHASVSACVSLGRAESFAMINLIYFVSLLFLNQEYIPFLPTAESEPQGPIDPPLLEAKAPDGWWSDRAMELFDSAQHITLMLRQLDENDCPLLTPYAGFCAFSAATMNIYESCFPRMNLNRSVKTVGRSVEDSMGYLRRFQNVWKMGERWVKTTERIQRLLTRASQDRQQFKAKTRDDFIALETYMQYARVSRADQDHPIDAIENVDMQNRGGYRRKESADEVPEVSSSGAPVLFPTSDPDLSADTTIDSQWNEDWPLWGHQEYVPFAIGGVPFDYNIDLGCFSTDANDA